MLPILASVTLGLHLASAHFPERDFSPVNPGIYFRTEQGLTGGFYRNSLGRITAYGGWEWQAGPVGFSLGLASGYQTQTRTVSCAKATFLADIPLADRGREGCTNKEGANAYLQPLATLSYRLPSIRGVVPRLEAIPPLGRRSVSVLAFSLEKNF